MLFKELATLRIDRSLLGRAEDLRWRGPTSEFARICAEIDAPGLFRRAEALGATVARGPESDPGRGAISHLDCTTSDGARPTGR